MLLKSSPFELDRESMILRNNRLLKHYDHLNLIKNRKNLFLPQITSPNKNKILSPKKINFKSKFKDIMSLQIEKVNENLCNKINEINNRPLKNLLKDQKLVYNLLNQKKKSRNKIRKLNMDLLIKSNDEIKKRLINIQPVISHDALDKEYKKTRKICVLNKKLKPCFSSGNNCLTRDDYSYIERSRESFSSDAKLNKIKIKKLGLSKNKE